VLLLVAGTGSAHAAAADSVRTESLLEELQRQDREFFSPELMEVDPSVRDSALASLDSLGFDQYRKEALASYPAWGFNFGGAGKLNNYNRVEGLVVGLKAGVESKRYEPLGIEFQGAYATASKEFRYWGALQIPLWSFYGEVGYSDRVVPFGSNRITGNGIRALVGGSDDQDWFRSQGGWVWLGYEPATQPFRPSTGLRFRLGYGADKETSVQTATEFSFLGTLGEPNPAIDEGYDRAVQVMVAGGNLGERNREIQLDYRVAGGALGGDFAYSWFAARWEERRYLFGRPELYWKIDVVTTGGAPPFQRLADEGGLYSVRGFRRRTRLGETSLNGRMELYLATDFFALAHIPLLKNASIQFVPWADAGRVWEGDSDVWLTSFGIGLQKYFAPIRGAANLRLDFAFPTGPDRPNDVGVFLRFTQMMF